MKIKCKNECNLNKYDGCCGECPHAEGCPEKCTENPNPQGCEDAIFEGGELEVFNSKAAAVIEKISLLVKQKTEIEAAEKKMREQLQESMEQYGIKQFDNEVIKVTYVEASTRSSVDSAKLKNKYPDIAAECSKTGAVKAFVKIELKGGDKK